MSLTWHGERLIDRSGDAQRIGLNETLAECVDTSKAIHTWRNRTGTLEGSIRIDQFAHRSGSGYAGTWGSKDVVYALIHELGGVVKPVRAKALRFQVDGQWVIAQSVTIPARPYLRPSADMNYPRLGHNIARALRYLGGGR